jgi:hypothetical protein
MEVIMRKLLFVMVSIVGIHGVSEGMQSKKYPSIPLLEWQEDEIVFVPINCRIIHDDSEGTRYWRQIKDASHFFLKTVK